MEFFDQTMLVAATFKESSILIKVTQGAFNMPNLPPKTEVHS